MKKLRTCMRVKEWVGNCGLSSNLFFILCIHLFFSHSAVADGGTGKTVVAIAGSREPVPWWTKGDSRDFEVELKQQGYASPGGWIVTEENGRFLPDDGVLTNAIVVNRRIKKFWFAYVTVPERDGNGRATYRLENAYEYVIKGREEPLLGSDSGCSSLLLPKLQVIAIGTWKWRKNPQLGGYAHSIKYAWVADSALKKLRPIPPESVVCKINEDRN